MALSIKSDRADRLARELAATTGESITDAVTIAIEDRLRRHRRDRQRVVDDIMAIASEAAALPVMDARSADEIIGYDEHGLPT